MPTSPLSVLSMAWVITRNSSLPLVLIGAGSREAYLHGAARLPRRERFLDDAAVGMIERKEILNRAPDRGGQRKLHRAIAEEQLSQRIEERHRVLEMFDRRLEARLLTGELRAIGRQLLADRVEERAQFAELVVLRQVELHAELTFAEPCESAAEHVDWPQQQLCEKRRDQDRHAERHGRGDERGSQRGVQLLAHQYGREADSNGAKCLVAEQHRLSHFERLSFFRIDHAQLVERALLEERRKIGTLRLTQALTRGIAARDDHAARVEDDGAGHALAVNARFEDRAEPRVGTQRFVRLGAVGDHFPRAVEDRVRKKLASCLALVQHDAGDARHVQCAQRHHRDTHDRGDAGDLLAFDA